MKYSAALLLALFSITAASILPQQEEVVGYNNQNNNNNNNNGNNNNNNGNNNQGNQQLLEKQFYVLRLLSNLQFRNPYPELVQLGRNFNPYQNFNRFYNQPAVKIFLNNFAQNNFLPKDEVFTPSSQQHQNQVAQLFHFFYSAQDFDTFKAAAAWARERVNPQQFAYAFSAAVLNHPSTQGVVVPALYEVVPHDFVPATAFHQIYKAKFEGYGSFDVYANYTNQNENNQYYSYYYNQNNNNNRQNNNENNNNNNNYNNYGPHNPNTVFAVNDGSQDNNAGTPENPENRVSYFTEDVGINAYHAGFHVQNPAFFGSNNNNNYFDSIFNSFNHNSNQNNNNNNDNYNYNEKAVKQGEAFYYAHQQFYARYVLERLSNNLPIPDQINFNDKIQPGYNPNLQYANGQAVPARPPNTYFQQQQKNSNNNNNNVQEPNNNQAQNPQVYEQRLQEVADTGFVVNPDGSKTNIQNQNGVGILANIAAFPANSPNPAYYGNYFAAGKNAIGFIVDPNNQNGVAPGPAANYATAPRDPAYYQFLAKLNQIFYNFQNNLGPYNQYELNFSGVKIQNFDVSRLVTYFDNFNVNVDNFVNTDNYNRTRYDNARYNVKFQRLTNQPFNYKLSVQSNKNTNAVVRVFIGPKFDSNGQQFTLPQASQYFVQLDQFTVQLNNGQNEIQRNSQQSPLFVQDAPSFQQLWYQVHQARQGNQPFYGNQVATKYWGFPQRAQLPKGKPTGQEFVFYAIVTPSNGNNNNQNNNNQNNNNNNDQNQNQNNNGNNNYNNDNYNNQNNNSENQNYNGNNNYNNQNNNNQNNNGNDYNNNNNNQVYDVQFYDNKSLGFPFDRPVVNAFYNTPNQYFKTVTIYHKTQNYNKN